MAGSGQARASGSPGRLPGAAMAALSGLVCWFWLAARPMQPEAAARAPALAAVSPADLPAALGTMSGSPDFLARFKAAAGRCAEPLAWVSVRAAPGSPPATLRLRSGNYVSPLFPLADAPARIAIPYPAPVATGRGTLTVLESGEGAVVALAPPWAVPAGRQPQTRVVTWLPPPGCAAPHG